MCRTQNTVAFEYTAIRHHKLEIFPLVLVPILNVMTEEKYPLNNPRAAR